MLLLSVLCPQTQIHILLRLNKQCDECLQLKLKIRKEHQNKVHLKQKKTGKILLTTSFAPLTSSEISSQEYIFFTLYSVY